jgi:hypothetical protein
MPKIYSLAVGVATRHFCIHSSRCSLRSNPKPHPKPNGFRWRCSSLRAGSAAGRREIDYLWALTPYGMAAAQRCGREQYKRYEAEVATGRRTAREQRRASREAVWGRQQVGTYQG